MSELRAGGSAASVVCADGKGLVLGVKVKPLGLGVSLAHSDGTTRADTACCDATRTVAEDVALQDVSGLLKKSIAYWTYSNEVEEADHNCEDARCDQKPPKGKTESLLACGFLVHVAQHVESEDHHSAAQSNETVGRAQKWPVASEEPAEERALRDNEEDADNSCNNVTCSIKKEELVLVSIRS